MMTTKIKRLDEAVVNRIAAGEVIQRPSNAVKELLENSLDAGSTQIQVTVKQGGLKLIQIQDNGCGIQKDDMDIVCERFTTSKLQDFSDLQQIATYGFRGEALASISHVAHVTVTSRTPGSQCAYKGEYSDGQLKSPVRPCAGNQGTCIGAEDLFYNVPLRRKTLKSPRDEFAKIADVVTKYAVHNSGVSVSLKRVDEGCAATDIKTTSGASTVDNIRCLFGANVARELLEVDHRDDKLDYKISGHITNANFSTKKMTFVLFINNRLVESASFKRAVENVYASILPKKSYPFLYLSLHLAPHIVDVNVHPTKHEVHFLHEDTIVSSIQQALEKVLLGSNESRTFFTQTLLPSSVSTVIPVMDKVRAQEMVRTDAREQKLEAFFSPTEKRKDTLSNTVDMTEVSSQKPVTVVEQNLVETPIQENSISAKEKEEEPVKQPVQKVKSNTVSSERREIKLLSILGIQSEIKSACSSEVRDMLKNLTFVGCVDRELCLVQHETRLLLLNLRKLTTALFYQLIFFEFGNLGELVLSEPVPLEQLALVGLDCELSGWKPEDGSKDELASYVRRVLCARRVMLWDYFSIKIDEAGNLISLPMMLEKYVPDLDALPLFVLRLATEVVWTSEKECFMTFAKEASLFYAQKYPLFPSGDAGSDNPEESGKCRWQWTVEHVMIPAIKTVFLPSKKHLEDGSILQLASLTDLYKVFERC